MTTGDTNAPRGGVNWELSEAERLMWEARTKEQRILAMRRHSEAIRNMMQAEIVPSFEKALSTILDRKLERLEEWLNNSDTARVQRNVELQEQIDARFDAFGDELRDIKVTIGARLDRKRERLDNHERRIARLEQHLGLDGDDR
jgi:hypothetical protein